MAILSAYSTARNGLYAVSDSDFLFPGMSSSCELDMARHITTIAFSSSGVLLASGSNDKSIHIWKLDSSVLDVNSTQQGELDMNAGKIYLIYDRLKY